MPSLAFKITESPEQKCMIFNEELPWFELRVAQSPFAFVASTAVTALSVSSLLGPTATVRTFWESTFQNLGLTTQSVGNADEPIQNWEIEQADLPPDEPYQVTVPIPVIMTKDSDTEFTAKIEAANLAATGNTRNEAFGYLVCELLDAFDYLCAHESELGAGPARQFAFLRTHLGKIDNGSR